MLARLPEGFDRFLVVASAGNTGRAFLQAASRCGVPVLVVVPRSALAMLWLTVDRGPRALLVAVDGDCADAIEFAGLIAALPRCSPEGGARNVARRDGRLGRGPMELHLVQAEPFAPMRDAWRAKSREVPAMSAAVVHRGGALRRDVRQRGLARGGRGRARTGGALRRHRPA